MKIYIKREISNACQQIMIIYSLKVTKLKLHCVKPNQLLNAYALIVSSFFCKIFEKEDPKLINNVIL